MIVERHYDDETLIGLLASSREAAPDPHLESCSLCAEMLASYRAIADVLGEEAVWELCELRLEPDPQTMASLRAAMTGKQAEEQNAAALIAELLSLPRESWVRTAQSDLHLHNLGIVSALIEASENVLATTPTDGLEIAHAAVEIADRIDVAEYPGDAVRKARAASRRQFGYSLFFTGEASKALHVIAQGERDLDGCAVADYELARLGIVRSLIDSSQERYEEALAGARKSVRVFEAYGDRARIASGLLTQAFMFMMQYRYADALPILSKVEQEYREDIDVESRARLLGNLGVCQAETGQIALAMQSFQVGVALADELGAKSDSAGLRYKIACLLASVGRLAEAESRFRSLRTEFLQLGMPHSSVSVGLELAELLIDQAKFDEIERLAQQALEQYQNSNLYHPSEAAVALRFLKEVARNKVVTREVVRYVRRHLERLPNEPELLFAPPPLPPS